MAHQINVAFGHDCVMDPWYSLGSHDMLEVASMGLHVGQLTGVAEIKQAFETITHNAAKVMNLQGYGLKKVCHAEFIVLQARSAAEAIRLRANCLYVVRRGKVIAQSEPAGSQLILGGQAQQIDWTH